MSGPWLNRDPDGVLYLPDPSDPFILLIHLNPSFRVTRILWVGPSIRIAIGFQWNYHDQAKGRECVYEHIGRADRNEEGKHHGCGERRWTGEEGGP